MQKDIWLQRFFLILTIALFVGMTTVEFLVALKTEFVQPLANKAMWAGTLLWIFFVAAGIDTFIKRAKKERVVWFLVTIVGILITAGTALGIYLPAFTSFARWANMALPTIMVFSLIFLLPTSWNSLTSQKSESSELQS